MTEILEIGDRQLNGKLHNLKFAKMTSKVDLHFIG